MPVHVRVECVVGDDVALCSHSLHRSTRSLSALSTATPPTSLSQRTSTCSLDQLSCVKLLIFDT